MTSEAVRLLPLRANPNMRANIEKQTVRRHVKKKEGLGEQLANITGSIDRSIPLFNVPIEAGEELGESITGQHKDKPSYLHPGQEGAAVTGAAVHAIPVVGAASELGEKGGETIAKHAKEIESSTKAIGKLVLKLDELKTWVRVGKVIGGALIIIFALWLLLKAISPDAASLAGQGMRK